MATFRRCWFGINYLISSLVLIISMLGFQATEAATYYVAPTGSDSNPGTDSKPFRTINYGVKPLKPGDTLLIRGGTYNEALMNVIPSGTSWDTPVTIKAYSAETVIMRPSSGIAVIHINGASRQYIILDGLRLDAVNGSYTAILIGEGGVPQGTQPSHIRFQNNNIINSAGDGVQVTCFSNDIQFMNNHIQNNGFRLSPLFGHGMYLNGSNMIIDGNEVHDNASYGIQIQADVSTPPENGCHYNIPNPIVRNNRVHDNNQSYTVGSGLVLGSTTGTVEVYNNLFYSQHTPGGCGVSIGYWNSSTIKAYNNTAYANDGGGVCLDHPTSYKPRVYARNNILYQNVGGDVRDSFQSPSRWNDGSGLYIADHNLSSDPKFINASSGDFRLQSGSTATDKGVFLSEVTNDYNRVLRPQGSAFDIGAYEYQGNILPSPTKLRISQQ